MRAAAPRALPAAPPPAMVAAFAPLLSDPVRAVRVEAARALAGADQSAMTAEQQTAMAAAYLELVAAEMIDADRPEAHLNLGLVDMRRGQGDAAEGRIPDGVAARSGVRAGPRQSRSISTGRAARTRLALTCCARPSRWSRTTPMRIIRSALLWCVRRITPGRWPNCARRANSRPTMRATPMSTPSR